MSRFVGRTVVGTVPSPLVVDSPFEDKLSYVITPQDCLFFPLFFLRQSTGNAKNGTGDAGSSGERRSSSKNTNDDVFRHFTGNVEEPLVVNTVLLERTLNACGETLKVLGLSFAYSLDESVIQLIAQNCGVIEYLDLSFSSPMKCHQQTRNYKQEPEGITLSPISVDVWKSLGSSIGGTLKHLNLTCFTGIDDESLIEFLQRCPHLEELHVSIAPFHLLKGYSLSMVPKGLRKISIFVDEKDGAPNVGVLALYALGKSAAKETLQSLRLRRSLTNDMLVAIADNFPHLLSLDIVECCSELLDFTKISDSIAALKSLESLSIHIPEDFEFDDDLTVIIQSCTKLKALAIFGGEINDESLKLLPKHIPDLEYLAFSHLMYPLSLAFDHCFTDAGLKSLSKLNKLKYLKINQARITDKGVYPFLLRTDVNRLEYLDFRECGKITDKTLRACLEMSKTKDKSNVDSPKPDVSYTPLCILLNGTNLRVSPKAAEGVPTARTPLPMWVNYPGFWNEYFTPYLNTSHLSKNCQRFIEQCLQYIAGHYVHTTFTKLRKFSLKVPPNEEATVAVSSESDGIDGNTMPSP